MVIPQGVITKPDRIVAALSARPGGEIVLPVAQNLASEWGASLEAIHVIEADVRRNLADSPRLEPTSRLLASIPSAGGRQIGIDALDEVDLRDRAIGWLTSTFSAVNSGVAYEGHIRMGDAGQELIAAVRNESGHPVIVMGRLGERVSALPIQAQYRCGSTTRMVLWAAPCPVLVVPIGWRVVDDLSIDTTMPARHIHLPDLRAGNRAPVLESMQGYSGDGNDAA